MSINNTQWVSGDLISVSKLSAMVQDSVNITDNIHPQYWDKLMLPWDLAFMYANRTAGVSIKSRALNPASGWNTDAVAGLGLFRTDLYTSGAMEDLAQFQFYRGITTSIDVGGFVANSGLAGGVVNSDVKFRIRVLKSVAGAADVSIFTGTVQDSTGTTFDAYTSSDIDISAIGSSDVVKVVFEAAINAITVDGRTGYAHWKGMYVTRKNPKL